MSEYICKVGGVVAPGGICGKIKCGSDDCGYVGECDYQILKCTQCGGKTFTAEGIENDSWKECEDCGVSV